jgi:hypothetical protein
MTLRIVYCLVELLFDNLGAVSRFRFDYIQEFENKYEMRSYFKRESYKAWFNKQNTDTRFSVSCPFNFI